MDEKVCQPPVVLDSTLPESDKSTKGKGSDNYCPLGIATLVFNNSGSARGLPQNPISEEGPSHTPSRPGIYNESRCIGFSGMAHIQESFES